MRMAQDAKYDVCNERIGNRRTGELIPDDESVFIFRTKDR